MEPCKMELIEVMKSRHVGNDWQMQGAAARSSDEAEQWLWSEGA